MKKLSAFLLLASTLITLTGCYDIKEISYTVAAIALGIDKGDSMKYKVTFHIEKSGSNVSDEGEKSKKPESELISIEAPTVSSAYERVNGLTSVDISIDNLKMVILSKEICEEGIYDVISELMCDMNLKNNAYVSASYATAKEIMEAVNPEEEEYMSVFYQRILFNNYKSETKFFLIEDVYFNLLSYPGGDIILPLASLKGTENKALSEEGNEAVNFGYIPKQDEHGVEFSGAAALSSGKLSGYLSENDMMAYSLLSGDFKTKKVSVEYPEGSGKYAVIEIKQHKKPRHETKIIDGEIISKANIYLSVTYQFVDEAVSYDEFNPTFSRYLKDEVGKMCCEFIEKTVYAYEMDVLSIGNRLKRCFLHNSEFEKFDYETRLKSGTYSVSARLEIRSGGRFVFR